MTVIVNGETIAPRDIEAEIARLKPDYERYVKQCGEEVDEDRLHTWSEENIIERLLVQQKAEGTEDITVSADDVEQAYERAKTHFEGKRKKDALQEIERHMKAEQLVRRVTDQVEAPTDDDVKAAYEAQQERFQMPEQVAVRHIEKKVHNPAEKTQAYLELLNVHEELKKGADFSAIAAEHSDCGGFDIGYFPRGQMVEEFENVVFALEVGAISEVFETPFGYHIAQVYDKKPAGPAPFEHVADRLRDELGRQKKSQAYEAFVDSLKEKATIERD